MILIIDGDPQWENGVCFTRDLGLKGGYLNFSHLNELKIYISLKFTLKKKKKKNNTNHQ